MPASQRSLTKTSFTFIGVLSHKSPSILTRSVLTLCSKVEFTSCACLFQSYVIVQCCALDFHKIICHFKTFNML